MGASLTKNSPCAWITLAKFELLYTTIKHWIDMKLQEIQTVTKPSLKTLHKCHKYRIQARSMPRNSTMYLIKAHKQSGADDSTYLLWKHSFEAPDDRNAAYARIPNLCDVISGQFSPSGFPQFSEMLKVNEKDFEANFYGDNSPGS